MADETRTLIAAGIAALERAATTPPAPYGYGRDLVCIDDLTTSADETDPTTIASLAQDLYHRCTTERGSLVDDPDYGDDARGFLNAALTPGELLTIGGRLSLECLKDDRVAQAVVTARLTAPGELTITFEITPAIVGLAPFTLILAITADTLPTLEIL